MKYKNVLKSCVHLRTLIGADEAESHLNPHFLKDFQPIRDPDASSPLPAFERVFVCPKTANLAVLGRFYSSVYKELRIIFSSDLS